MRAKSLLLALCLSLFPLPSVAASLGDIDRAIAQSDFQTAMTHAAAARDQGRYGRWLIDYVGAYALLSEGRNAEALTMARHLVARRPEDVRVRQLLIVALVAEKNYRSAIYHMRENREVTPDPAVKAEYDELIAVYEKANPKSGMSINLDAKPSTNITRGSGQETIVINGLPFIVDEASRERAGGTVTLGVSGYARAPIGERTDIIASSGVSLEKGVSGSENDVVSFNPSAQIVHYTKDGFVSAGPIAEFQMLDLEPFARRYGGSARFSKQLGERVALSVAATALRQEYQEADFLDGYKLSETVSLRGKITDDLAVTVAASHVYENTKADHLTYHEGEIRLGIERLWENGVVADLSASAAIKRYQADFPIAAEPRADERYTIQAGIGHEKLAFRGIVPYVGVRYTRNVSNISLYDYDSTDLIVSGRKKF